MSQGTDLAAPTVDVLSITRHGLPRREAEQARAAGTSEAGRSTVGRTRACGSALAPDQALHAAHTRRLDGARAGGHAQRVEGQLLAGSRLHVAPFGVRADGCLAEPKADVVVCVEEARRPDQQAVQRRPARQVLLAQRRLLVGEFGSAPISVRAPSKPSSPVKAVLTQRSCRAGCSQARADDEHAPSDAGAHGLTSSSRASSDRLER
jgi:hypothetical protein